MNTNRLAFASFITGVLAVLAFILGVLLSPAAVWTIFVMSLASFALATIALVTSLRALKHIEKNTFTEKDKWMARFGGISGGILFFLYTLGSLFGVWLTWCSR
jgi:hypothetical protein